MQSDLLARKANLETNLSKVAGVPVEITFRGLREFTVSAEGDQCARLERVRGFLGAAVGGTWEMNYDAETDFTCAWFSVHPSH